MCDLILSNYLHLRRHQLMRRNHNLFSIRYLYRYCNITHLDNHAANALLDTMVRHGPEGGSLVVRRALNATTGKSLPPLDTGSGRMGPQTLGRLEEVYKSPTLKRGFYDHLADERLKDKNDGAGDRTRYDYYRLNK